MGGCLIEEVALFEVSWCSPPAPSCFAQADRAAAGCRFWCSTVSAGRARAEASADAGVAVMFLLNFYECATFVPLDHTPLIYHLFRGSRSYYSV